MNNRQRGISFIGVLFVVGVLAFAGVIAAQAFPTVVEFQAITKAATKAAAGASVTEVRTIFDKAAQIDDIKSISGKDLEVSKEGDKTVVSFAYNKEIHIAGPAFLLLKYAGRSK
jgi:Tfp pilus assembly protein PilE